MAEADTQGSHSLPANDTMLDLMVEVATISTSVKEVAQLKQGSKIQVDPGLTKTIKLICNGKEVGSGEATRIGDLWGIRVREVFPNQK